LAGVKPNTWANNEICASRVATIVSTIRNPCHSPSKVKSATGNLFRPTASAIMNAWFGGTTLSSIPCSNNILLFRRST
jgi:hypothetical protein